jgi:cysteine-rich repeat protein
VPDACAGKSVAVPTRTRPFSIRFGQPHHHDGAVLYVRGVGNVALALAGCGTLISPGTEHNSCLVQSEAPDICGDGVVTPDENCDDGNTISGDGCSANCTIEAGFACNGSPSVCIIP